MAELSFAEALLRTQQEVESFLGGHFDGLARSAASSRLQEAMRYGVLNGGKRLRPFLVLTSASLFDVSPAHAVRVAAALECVHCYSLIHDDLPAMDNDDFRRGQPTLHRAFDEATAILAGDALLTEAFLLLSNPESGIPAERRADLVLALAGGAGAQGMVAGQMLDLAAEGRFDANAAPIDEAGIKTLQALKTGALLRFACEAGFRLASSPGSAEKQALTRFGELFGLAFQLKDDLLDVEGDASLVGKATGKDAAAGKATLVGIYGIEGARGRLDRLNDEAEAVLQVFSGKARLLADLITYNRDRRS